jgi:L-serine dehydratase
MTTVDEFYKVGPGPSSSHTIGPMRITYDFYQRDTKLPADKLAKATKLQVNLFGSLSDGQGTRNGAGRARRAGRQRTGNRRPEIPRQPARQA